jgi:hypothetical protein
MKKLNINYDKILEEVKKIIKEGDEFSGEDFNGPDPLEKTSGELSLANAVTEYCNQTGKQIHAEDLEKIILGIVRDFDTTEKIEQLSRFVDTILNAKQHVREPEDVEDLEVPEDSMPDDEFGEEDEFGEDELETNEEDLEAVEDVNEEKEEL